MGWTHRRDICSDFTKRRRVVADLKVQTIIDALWNWFSTKKGHPVVKDATKLSKVKFDCFFESSVSDPLSFSVFSLSDKGELEIDDVQKLAASEAAYFLFVNPKTGWMVAVKNTQENLKKLIKKEPIQNLKIKIIE
jgi:hypothetical protein